MKINSTLTGYRLYLSDTDTKQWAERQGENWPCSTLSGHLLAVEVGQMGLNDMSCTADEESIDHNELRAIVSDHLLAQYRHLWPCWGEYLPVNN